MALVVLNGKRTPASRKKVVASYLVSRWVGCSSVHCTLSPWSEEADFHT